MPPHLPLILASFGTRFEHIQSIESCTCSLPLQKQTWTYHQKSPLSFNDTVRQFSNSDDNTQQLQRFITSKLKVSTRVDMKKSTTEMAKHCRARLNSTDSKHSNLIFRLLPTSPDLTLDPDDWDQFRARLAYPPDDNLPTLCPHCRADISSRFAKTITTVALRCSHLEQIGTMQYWMWYFVWQDELDIQQV